MLNGSQLPLIPTTQLWGECSMLSFFTLASAPRGFPLYVCLHPLHCPTGQVVSSRAQGVWDFHRCTLSFHHPPTPSIPASIAHARDTQQMLIPMSRRVQIWLRHLSHHLERSWATSFRKRPDLCPVFGNKNPGLLATTAGRQF